MFLIKYQLIWPSSFRREDFSTSANQKQELPVATMLTDWKQMKKFCKGPLTDAFYQISVI